MDTIRNTIRPREEITHGKVSRQECNKTLQHVVPVGSTCMVFKNKVKNSALTDSKAAWRMAIGSLDGLVLFWDPITGAVSRSNSYVRVPLAQGIGFQEVWGITDKKRSGPHMRSGKRRVQLEPKQGERVLCIQDLGKLIVHGQAPRLHCAAIPWHRGTQYESNGRHNMRNVHDQIE